MLTLFILCWLCFGLGVGLSRLLVDIRDLDGDPLKPTDAIAMGILAALGPLSLFII